MSFLASARVLPLDDDGTSLTLAMVSPYDDFTAKAVALKSQPLPMRSSRPRPAISETLRDSASDAPVIWFVNVRSALLDGTADDLLYTGRSLRRIRISAPVFERVFFQIYGVAATGPAVT